MALPDSCEARPFYRSAIHRYEDALILLQAAPEHSTGAVYLAGYGIECILKALILNTLAQADRTEMLRSFRGARAHDYSWLRYEYLRNGGPSFPANIRQAFTLVNDWSTDLRSDPRQQEQEDAKDFLDAARTILTWAKERM